MRTTLFAGIALAAALAACGGKTLKEFQPSATDKQNAAATIDDTKSLANLRTNSQDGAALSAFSEIQAGANQLLGSAQVAKGLSAEQSGLRSYENCVTEAGGTITYNNCTDGSQTINGTISISGDTVSVDLRIGYSSGGYSGDVTYQGSVTITASSVNGSLSFDYEMASTTYSVDISYEAIGLDAAGCAISGSMAIDQSVKIAGVGSLGGVTGGSTGTSFRVDFGPACGDMKMFGG